jgi:hypothetical protein
MMVICTAQPPRRPFADIAVTVTGGLRGAPGRRFPRIWANEEAKRMAGHRSTALYG